MSNRIGILVFDGAEEMDFVGPWEVLRAATLDKPDEQVMLIAPKRGEITCDKGMRVVVDTSIEEVDNLDVLIIPGGGGATAEISNPATVAWLNRVAPTCTWVTSVCTGAGLLVGAGLVKGRRITTHHFYYEKLREHHDGEVIEGQRIVRDGNVVTAGGVMSGIELTLWLVGQLYDEKTVDFAKHYIAYDYPPADAVDDRD